MMTAEAIKANYTTDHFINRENKLFFIRTRLSHIKDDLYFSDWIIRFVGIHRIGKTTLLSEIKRLCEIYGVDYIDLDFRKIDNKTCDIITEIAKKIELLQPDLAKRPFGQLPILPTVQELYNDGRLTENVPQNIRQLAKLIDAFLQREPLVLMFDTIEQAELSHLDWLESLFRLLASERRTRLMIILAGRVDRRLRRFEVRQHSISWQLSAFDINHTEKQLSSLNRAYIDFAKEVYHLTYGHPLNNRIVADYLLTLQERGVTIDRDVFRKYEKQLIQELRTRFIDQVVMKSISDEKIKEALELIAPLRSFDIDLLSQLIDEFSLPYGGGFGVLRLRRDMMRTHLLVYDELRKALALEPTVRRILTLSMRHFAPDRYREVHQFAFRFNMSRLQKSSGRSRTLFMTEVLYHRANLLTLEGRPAKEVGELLTQDLLDLEPEMTLVDAEQLQAELENDGELKDILAEGLNIIRKALKKIVNQKQMFDSQVINKSVALHAQSYSTA